MSRKLKETVKRIGKFQTRCIPWINFISKVVDIKVVSTTVQTTEIGNDDEDDKNGEDDEKTKVVNIQTIWSS